MRFEAVHTKEDICLEDLGECLHDTRILVAVYLDLIDQGNFDLWPFAECLENRSEFLSGARQSASGESRDADTARTPTSRRARPSIWSGRALQSTEAMRPCQTHWINSVSGSDCSSNLLCIAEMIWFAATQSIAPSGQPTNVHVRSLRTLRVRRYS